MFSGGWVKFIHENYDIPAGFAFSKQDLAKALRTKYNHTLDNTDFANDHGVYRDHKKEVDPLTNEGNKIDQWYFAVVTPGALRPSPKGGGAWYDDVWIKPPKKTSSRNLNAAAADGDVVAQRAMAAAKEAMVAAAAAKRPSTRSNPKPSAAASSSKRKAASDAHHDGQGRLEGGQYSFEAGKKKARNMSALSMDDIMKEASGFDGLLFPTNAEGVVSKTNTFECDDGKSIVVIMQQQLNNATSSAPSSLAVPPKDNDIEWTSANELKASLGGRTSGLTKAETDVLRELTRGQVETEGKSQPSKVVLPKGKGQSQETVYIKQPPKRIESRKGQSTNEIINVTREMADSTGVDMESIIELIATYEGGNYVPPAHDNEEQLLHQSTAFVTDANLSLSQYHLIRMYVWRIWKLKIGAPVQELERSKVQLRSAQRAASHGLTINGNGADRGAIRARNNARRDLQSAEKKVADDEKELRDINQYIADLEVGKKDTEAYISKRTKRRADLRKKRTLAALVLDDCYFKVCGLTPRKYWGGRTYVFRDALCLMEKWDEIAQEFSAAMERITGGRFGSYVQKCKAAMAKATAEMKYLYPAAVMSKSQKKLDDDKKREFKNLCINIGKEVRKQYPKRNIWWKLHTTETHIWQVAEYWGFLGIASEEGFESAHVILNRIDSVLGQTKNKERKVQAHRVRIGVRQDANTTRYRNEFKESKKKIVDRKSPTNANNEENDEEGALQQYDILPNVPGRAQIVKCRWCRRRCPESSIQFHIMASHMCSNVSLAGIGDDLPDLPEAEAEADDIVQPQ